MVDSIKSIQRNRVVYAALVAGVVGCGLASRSRYADFLPEFVATYSGDTLWALMVFLLVGFVFPRRSTIFVAVLAIGFSVTIEVSQLYQADWINGIRETRLGGLVLGFGFLWADLVCYTTGVATGVLGEWFFGLSRAKIWQEKPADRREGSVSN